jgi:hypothetical protein
MLITTERPATTTRPMKVAYWAATGFAACGCAATGIADLLRAPQVMEGLAHLGYPAYFATILGLWQLLGAAVIVANGLQPVKEWAYAGMFFTLTGAAVSHAVSGDPLAKILVPLVLLVAVVASSALRSAREARVA